MKKLKYYIFIKLFIINKNFIAWNRLINFIENYSLLPKYISYFKNYILFYNLLINNFINNLKTSLFFLLIKIILKAW